VEEPLTSPRHKACAVGIDDFIVITGGTMLGLGKHKPSWLAEIGTRFELIVKWDPLALRSFMRPIKRLIVKPDLTPLLNTKTI
jgi:hypothetical protein